MADKQWILFGLGFNTFGQLDSHESSKDTASKNQKPSQETEQSKQHQESKDELVVGAVASDVLLHDVVFAVDTPKELLSLSSQPSLAVSVSWDTVHIHVQVDDKKQDGSSGIVHTITNGRWRSAMDKCKKHLELSGPVRRVTETNNYLIFQTDRQTLILDQQQHDQVSQSDLRPSCFCALSDNKIYALLENGDFHEVSLKETENSRETKCLLTLSAPVQTGVPIRQVACGLNHIILLARTGVLFSFGLNDRGQSGHRNIRPQANPTIVEALQGIAVVAISCGHWHSIVLSEFGDVYSWGWNEHNQLGHSVDTSTVATPTLIEADEDINFISVSCGARHSMALSETHVLYVWGWNAYGQLGRSSNGEVIRVPTQFNGLSEGMVVESVYCGQWCTFMLASKVVMNNS